MKFIRRGLIFLLVYILLIQFALPFLIPSSIVYNHRMKYDVIKNNIDNVEAVLKKIKEDIKERKLKEYVVILGDSVAYSSPGGEDTSIAYYMNGLAEKEKSPLKVYNLALPSNYPGDLYTMIKLMDTYGISTDHLIINFIYSEFLSTDKSTGIFWMSQYLRDVDYEAFEKIYVGRIFEKDKLYSFKKMRERLMHILNKEVPLLVYKDYIRNGFIDKIRETVDADYKKAVNIRPWYEKKDLPKIMLEEKNKWYYSDTPFIMDERNASIYFINKIMEHQKNKDTIVFLAASNRKLIPEATSKKGYNDNLRKIDEYFKGKPVTYINYDGKIDYNLFSDYVHLIPKGYEFLAKDLWAKVKSGLKDR
ncbi:MAG: hypothetical protein N2645_09355 [Clostridia bacterium]|nr:hypothetical protein [Clostridia bacterium]